MNDKPLLLLSGKTSDMFAMSYIIAGRTTVFRYEGEVPYDLEIGGGDYFRLIVDPETGLIQNWNSAKVKSWIKEKVTERNT